MAYAEIYNHKQAQQGIAQSPDTSLGVGQSGQQDRGITAKATVGLMAAAAFVAPAVKTGFNKVIDATGNSRLKRTISQGAELVTAGIGIYAFGWVGVGVAGVKYGGELIVKAFDEFEIQENDRYLRELRGVQVKGYNAGVDYND
jgi:hypothetical protein